MQVAVSCFFSYLEAANSGGLTVEKWLGLCLILLPLSATTSTGFTQGTSGPFGEQLIAPAPQGFKLDAKHDDGHTMAMEYIPPSETASNSSVEINVMITRGHLQWTPERFSGLTAKALLTTCSGTGHGDKITDGQQNGYDFAQWTISCDLDGLTGKPLFVMTRMFQGQDAFYDVQYIFRRVPTNEDIKEAAAYLDTVSICDTRRSNKPCKAP